MAPGETQSLILREAMVALEEAAAIAEDAISEAEKAAARPKPEPVQIVKVARARANQVAKTLHDTGAFPQETVETLSATLEKSGSVGCLELLETLASRTPSTITSLEDLGGELVEKQADNHQTPASAESSTGLWRRCIDEAEAEFGD